MKKLFVLLLVLIAVQATGQGVWTPAKMIRFCRLDGTDVTPDGRWVAYSISKPIMDDDRSEFVSQIWIASTDGKLNYQFTQGDKSCMNPAFSPDGNYLAFLSNRNCEGKGKQVWAMRINGGEAEQITRSTIGVEQFSWSPDSRTIAYTQPDGDRDEDEKLKLEKRDWNIVDHWKYAHLYTISFDKTPAPYPNKSERKVRRLTAGKFHVNAFDWSPDSRTIAFSYQQDPSPDSWGSSDISVVAADSSAARSLVAMKGFDFRPLFSPDGQSIAFMSDGGEAKWGGTSDVYVMPVNGGQPRKLAESHDRQAGLFSWSADGKDLYYTETDRTSNRIFALPVNGGPYRSLTPGAGNFGGPSFSADNKIMAFIHQTPEKAPQVFVTGPLKFEPKKLSDANKDMPDFPMGKTEVIRWKSSDGKEIEGLLTYPVHYVAGHHYPFILNVHGGPAGVFTQNFTAMGSVYPIQAFAQQGYAILRPNPRGSSGYGRDFRHSNYNDWGRGDYDDDQAGVDKVIAMGIAHPDSLVICGWSYGGYMTTFALTKTRRFKAASAGAPVTNLISFVGTSDIAGFVPDYFGGEYWDKLDDYIRHSALFNVKSIKTPTQVIHGERDLRVPTSQGYEFYTALKRMGVATEMITYPRTPHGVQEPKFIEDIGERVIHWFNKQLQRGGAE